MDAIGVLDGEGKGSGGGGRGDVIGMGVVGAGDDERDGVVIDVEMDEGIVQRGGGCGG